MSASVKQMIVIGCVSAISDVVSDVVSDVGPRLDRLGTAQRWVGETNVMNRVLFCREN